MAETSSVLEKRKHGRKGKKIGLPDRDLINPPYQIANEAGSISNKSIDTDIIHAGEGYAEYDTHNLYGTSTFPGFFISIFLTKP